jgi:NitT/TauT family transport system permease protein
MREKMRLLFSLLIGAAVWDIAVRFQAHRILPGPADTAKGVWELVRGGVLFRYVIASLFRVIWGYLLGVSAGVPLGLLLGSHRRGERLVTPLIRIFRPISPLAWIPFSILWFGLDDRAPIFLIFTATFLPMTEAAINAVKNVSPVHINAGRNFGLSQRELILRVIYPAVAPHMIIGLRISLGIAWLVVVAAEMIAVNSGLGFLIIDARNAGNRYDLVVAGMILIGIIGLTLDRAMQRMERYRFLSWSKGTV